MSNVVAYGTLMFPEVAYPVAQIETVGEPALVRGFRRYEVFTKEWGGNFPAIVRDDSCCFEGLLFRDLTDEQIAKLDWFEDVEAGDYSRERALAEVGNEKVEAWVYVMGPNMDKRKKERLHRVWSPEQFRRSELELYLARVVYPAVNGRGYAEAFGSKS